MNVKLYYLGLFKYEYTVWRSHNDEIAYRHISQNVSPSFSDVWLYFEAVYRFLRHATGAISFFTILFSEHQ
jgi:hypothetical protein